MSAVQFSATLNTTQLQNALAQSNQQVGVWARGVENQVSGVDAAMNKLGAGLAVYFGAEKLKQFSMEVIEARGQFQQLGIAFETMLGSKDKADKLMSEAITFAQKTPFTLADVATNTKQLMAMGVAVEDVMSTMKSLGDVASGVSVPISRVAINYGQVMVLGRLQAREVRDFAMAGIPLTDELAKNLGKSKDEITAMISASQISAKMVTEAFSTMSGAGGKFYNLMEKQNASVTGQISNITDKWQLMLNDIGKSNEGVIYGGINGINTLITNYKTVANVLTDLILTFGTYKVAVWAVTLSENAKAVTTARNLAIETAYQASLATTNVQMVALARGISVVTVERELLAAATNQVAVAEAKALAAQKAPMLSNWMVLAATAAVALGFAIYKLITYHTDLEKAVIRSNTEISNETDRSAELFASLKYATEGTAEWKKAKDAIISQYGTYLTSQQQELLGTQQQGEAQDIVNKGLAENIALKVKQEATAAISQKYNPKITEATTSLKETVSKSLGATEAANVGQEIAPLIANIKVAVDSESQKKAEDALEAYMRKLQDTVSGGSVWSSAGGKVSQFRSDIERALESWKTEMDATNKAFDVQDKKTQKPKQEVTTTTYQKEIDKLNEKKKKAQDELNDLETKPYIVEEKSLIDAIKEKKAEIKGYDDDLETKKTGQDEKRAKKSAQEIADANLKVVNDQKKQALELQSTELENQQSLLGIKEDGFTKSQEQLKLNAEKEKLTRAKLTQELIEKQQEVERNQWEASGKKGVFSPKTKTADDLSAETKKSIEDSAKVSGLVTIAQNEKLIKDLLAQYKDYADQKAAIDKKYNEDLAAIQSLPEGEGKTNAIAKLKEDWKDAVSKISLEDFQKKIDWSTVFGDLDKVSTVALTSLRDKLKTYLTTVGTSISKVDLKEVTDKFELLDKTIADRRPIQGLIESFKDYQYACDAVAEAQQKVNDITKLGEANAGDLAIANNQLTAAQNTRRESLVKMSTSINAVGKAGQQIMGTVSDITDIFANFGVEFGDGLKKYLDGTSKIIDGLSSIDLTKPFSIVTGAVKMLSGMVDQVAAIFGNGAHELSQKVIDYYDDLMTVMDDVISKHKELLNELSGASAVAEAQAAIDLINKQIEATRKLGLEYLSSNAAHSHSYGHNLAVALDEYRAQLKSIGVDLSDSKGGIGQLFTMTPEQLLQIKEEVPAAWAKIDDKTREYLQTIIDSKSELDDVSKALGESLTGLTFDSAKSSLTDLLESADTTFADIADNFEDYMRNAIVKALVSGQLEPLIKQWYVDFTKAMEDGILTEKEKNDLQNQYNSIGQTGLNIRDSALSAAGITSNISNPALTGNEITRSITEETPGEFVGLMRRQADDTVKIRDYTKLGVDHMINIEKNTLDTVARLDSAIIELQAINKNTKGSYVGTIGK